MDAIAFGTFREIKELIETGSSFYVRDHQGRSPWLLSLHAGNLDKAKMLVALGAPKNDLGASGIPPLSYAIEAGHLKMVNWLISIGSDINRGDAFGCTPLMLAASRGETEIVRWLLNQGADPKRQDKAYDNAMSLAANLEIAQLLAAAGENLQDLDEAQRAELTGLGEYPLITTPKEYKAGRARWFGKTNPEVMDVAFWQAMVRCRKSAYEAQAAFSKVEPPTQPVWCYDRFGQTLTCLPDGRIFEIGGEHEDFYDPDLCIYNDVVVYDGEGQFTIIGYPSLVFPPTDFHSATLVGDAIYIIGSLGYKAHRHYGDTPVYRLDCKTFEIERVKTTGHKPGWISRHHAQFLAPNQIVISGGKIDCIVDGKSSYVDHEGVYSLDLTTFAWRRDATMGFRIKISQQNKPSEA